MRRFMSTVSGIAALWAGSALAGAGGQPPGGGGGGSGSEPEVIALIIFSLIPGIYFARKAMAKQAPKSV